MKPDLGTWLTIADTARRLEVKERTIIAWVKARKLRPQKYARPGIAGAPISLFDPEDVEALRAERAAAKAQVISPGAAIDRPAAFAPAGDVAAVAVQLAKLLPPPANAALMEAQYRDAIRKDKYLTLAEASALTKLSQREIHERLKDQARRGAGGRNVYPREAVEAL